MRWPFRRRDAASGPPLGATNPLLARGRAVAALAHARPEDRAEAVGRQARDLARRLRREHRRAERMARRLRAGTVVAKRAVPRPEVVPVYSPDLPSSRGPWLVVPPPLTSGAVLRSLRGERAKLEAFDAWDREEDGRYAQSFRDALRINSPRLSEQELDDLMPEGFA